MAMAANTLDQLRGLAEDSEAGTIVGGVAFGVGLMVVAYKAGRRVYKWRKARRVASLAAGATAIGLGLGLGPTSAPPVPQAIVAPSVGNASFHTAPEDSDDEQPSGG
jgi:hypothetical protein